MDSSRSEKILAMMLLTQMQQASVGTKAQALNRVGFSNGEIAELLGVTPAVVGQRLYELRGAGKQKRSASVRKTGKVTRSK
jgi:predicted transcriptional regulator